MTQKTSTSSRAEKIREKRQQGKKTPARKPRTKQKRKLSDSTPVMVRATGRSGSGKRAKRKNKGVKRRYDIALPTQGVEMRLPSVPSIKMGWRLLSFFMLIGLSFGFYYMWTSPEFLVQEVFVDGTVQFAADSISQKLLVYQKPIYLIEPQKLEQQLLDQFPGLLSISVQVGFPAQIAVMVEERVPVILWAQDGTDQWIDAQGIAFDPPGLALGLVHVQASASPPAPFLTQAETPEEIDSGPEIFDTPKAFMTAEMVAAILALGDQLPKGVTLLFDNQHGFGWRDPAGWDVYFGMDDKDMSMKLKVYDSVVQKLRAEGIQPAVVSVEYLHAPFYLER